LTRDGVRLLTTKVAQPSLIAGAAGELLERFVLDICGAKPDWVMRDHVAEAVAAIRAQVAGKLANARWLAQGTIYPDVIESGGAKTKKATTIKSHHNVGGLPETLGLKLLEPLRDLFKDEVRELGIALGLPPAMVYRHPFPGPGLGVRILGEVRPEYAELLRRADEHVVALRAVQTSDFMTADWAELPYALLKKVSGRIINEVRGINRVVYDVSSKPPATIEWE
jgi:GMP synthase (glutamine-hydrolysing)